MPQVTIQRTGLVCSLGASAPAVCAAIRAKVSNPTESRFLDSGRSWIVAHQAILDAPWRGLERIARMAAMAIEECLDGIPRSGWSTIELLLCAAERDRPGRIPGLDEQILGRIEALVGTRFGSRSAVVPQGRVSVAVALARGRKIVESEPSVRVLVAATDSLLCGPVIRALELGDRLLTTRNSNGLLPGEAAGALLLAAPGQAPCLSCRGIGFGLERAHIGTELPLRGDGLTLAIQGALAEVAGDTFAVDYRITDLSGEHYYFKEAALAASRTLRDQSDRVDMWHPAECIGETGAAAGVVILCVAAAASRGGYSPGPNVLVHLSNDNGARAALAMHFGMS